MAGREKKNRDRYESHRARDEEDKNLNSCDPAYNMSANGQGWIKLNGPCCGGGEHACMNLNRNCGPSYAKIG